MPSRHRIDAICLTLTAIRSMLPGRKLVALRCPRCDRPCRCLWLHPSDPERWKCAQCQHFSRRRDPEQIVKGLVRAQQSLQTLVHKALNGHLHETADR